MRAICILLLAAGTASAGNNEISIGGTTRALRSTSGDAVTADSLDGGTLLYARALPIDTLPHLVLWAEGAMDWGSANGQMFQVLSTELGENAFTLGARARYTIWRRLAASARLAVGTVREQLKITDDMANSATDHGWGALVAGSIAVEGRLIDAPQFALGLRLELGYVEASPVALAARTDTSSNGTLMLPMQDASLGKLDLSGPSFGFTLFSQF